MHLENYDRQLTRVGQAIAEIGEEVKEMIRLAERSLTNPSHFTYDYAKRMDQKVNALEAEIDQVAKHILSHRQPMAADFRLVSSALKVCGYFEDMGDIAKRIVRKVKDANVVLPPHAIQNFVHMANMLIEMIDGLFDGMKQKNIAHIMAVWHKDALVDRVYDTLISEIESEVLKGDAKNIHAYMLLILVAKSFERLGDYTSRLVKVFYYIITGERFSKEAIAQERAESIF